MKHYEKLAEEFIEKDIIESRRGSFLAGYRAAMEELKTEVFQYHLDGYNIDENETAEENFKNRDMDFVTLERIYESLNRDVE